MPNNLEDITTMTQAGLVLLLREGALKGASKDVDERLALLRDYYADNLKTLPPELFSRKIVWDYVNGRTQPENMRLIRNYETSMQVIALAVHDASVVQVVDSFPENDHLKTLAGYVLAWEITYKPGEPDIMKCVDLGMAARASQDPWLTQRAEELLAIANVAYAKKPLSD